MDVMESIRAAIKELILPDLSKIREESKEIKAILTLTNKRLDDVNLHLADQSRRIDAVRDELVGRIDDTNKRIDAVRDELVGRIDDTNKRIDAVRDELVGRIDDTNKRIDAQREHFGAGLQGVHQRMDRLYDVIVRRDEHYQLVQRVLDVERDVADLKRKIAA